MGHWGRWVLWRVLSTPSSLLGHWWWWGGGTSSPLQNPLGIISIYFARHTNLLLALCCSVLPHHAQVLQSWPAFYLLDTLLSLKPASKILFSEWLVITLESSYQPQGCLFSPVSTPSNPLLSPPSSTPLCCILIQYFINISFREPPRGITTYQLLSNEGWFPPSLYRAKQNLNKRNSDHLIVRQELKKVKVSGCPRQVQTQASPSSLLA